MLLRRQIGSDERDIAAVYGMTVIAGRVVSLNLYDGFEGRSTFDRLLASAKEAIARTLAANSMSLPPGMSPVGEGPSAQSAPQK